MPFSFLQNVLARLLAAVRLTRASGLQAEVRSQMAKVEAIRDAANPMPVGTADPDVRTVYPIAEEYDRLYSAIKDRHSNLHDANTIPADKLRDALAETPIPANIVSPRPETSITGDGGKDNEQEVLRNILRYRNLIYPLLGTVRGLSYLLRSFFLGINDPIRWDTAGLTWKHASSYWDKSSLSTSREAIKRAITHQRMSVRSSIPVSHNFQEAYHSDVQNISKYWRPIGYKFEQGIQVNGFYDVTGATVVSGSASSFVYDISYPSARYFWATVSVSPSATVTPSVTNGFGQAPQGDTARNASAPCFSVNFGSNLPTDSQIETKDRKFIVTVTFFSLEEASGSPIKAVKTLEVVQTGLRRSASLSLRSASLVGRDFVRRVSTEAVSISSPYVTRQVPTTLNSNGRGDISQTVPRLFGRTATYNFSNVSSMYVIDIKRLFNNGITITGQFAFFTTLILSLDKDVSSRHFNVKTTVMANGEISPTTGEYIFLQTLVGNPERLFGSEQRVLSATQTEADYTDMTGLRLVGFIHDGAMNSRLRNLISRSLDQTAHVSFILEVRLNKSDGTLIDPDETFDTNAIGDRIGIVYRGE